MTKRSESTHPNASAFPVGMPGPALRALASAGIRSMRDLASWSERDIAALHGMGPKAMQILRQGLAEK
jgi:predicted flap endonuclease-1-like 5' DNA nuclease